jgi:spore germination protein YaaH
MSTNEADFKLISVESASKEAAATKQPVQKSLSGKKPHFKAPAGTTEYLVQESDTIEHIALKWNTIPSEIQHLNRLINPRMIFPGQVLYVPDPNYVKPKPELSKSNENLASPSKPKTITLDEAKARSASFNSKNKQPPLLSPQKNANDSNNNTKKSYFSVNKLKKIGKIVNLSRCIFAVLFET